MDQESDSRKSRIVKRRRSRSEIQETPRAAILSALEKSASNSCVAKQQLSPDRKYARFGTIRPEINRRCAAEDMVKVAIAPKLGEDRVVHIYQSTNASYNGELAAESSDLGISMSQQQQQQQFAGRTSRNNVQGGKLRAIEKGVQWNDGSDRSAALILNGGGADWQKEKRGKRGRRKRGGRKLKQREIKRQKLNEAHRERDEREREMTKGKDRKREGSIPPLREDIGRIRGGSSNAAHNSETATVLVAPASTASAHVPSVARERRCFNQVSSSADDATALSGSNSAANRRRRSHNSVDESEDDGSEYDDEDDEDDDTHHFDGNVGTRIHRRYVVEALMGKGTFGKVFHCTDAKYGDAVAVKVVRKVRRYVESAEVEAGILEDVYEKQKLAFHNGQIGAEFCVKMYSHFFFQDHYCMVFEPLGMSLYDVLKDNDYARFPLDVVSEVAQQLIEALMFLRSMHLVHTDLKLENVLFTANPADFVERRVEHNGKRRTIRLPSSARIKLIDFGGATYSEDCSRSRVINTRQYRGPEVLLGLRWSYPSDVWSAGCIIAEIYAGELLFETHDELEHLALIEKRIGLFPRRMVAESPHRHEYFRRSDDTVRTEELPRQSRRFVNETASLRDFFTISREDSSSGIYELMRALLRIDPTERVTAREALEGSFKFLEYYRIYPPPPHQHHQQQQQYSSMYNGNGANNGNRQQQQHNSR